MAVDYQVPIGTDLSGELRLGYASLDRRSGAGGDLSIWDLTGTLALRRPIAGRWWWQIHGGAGLYYLDSTDLEAGYTAGGGIGFTATTNLSLEGVWSRHEVVTASPDVELDKLMIGLFWRLP